MVQKIIKVGNSFALTIPKSFIDETGFKAGDELFVQQDIKNKAILITIKDNVSRMKLSPELFTWLDTIENKYSDAIKQLAHK